MKIGRKILATLAVLLVAGLAAIVWLGSNFALRPPWYEHRTPEQGLLPATPFMLEHWNRVVGDPLSSLGLAFEEVEFPAVDGSPLRGWWIPPAAPTESVVVAVHGAASDRREFLRHTPLLHRAGYAVLLFDCREQGVSDGEGRGVSLGIREHADVSSAVDYVLGPRAMQRVAVMGSSQGGASVLLAGAADPRIDAVIAENPFTSIHALILDNSMEPTLPGPLLAAISFVTRLRLGGLDAPDPIEVVGRIAPRPLLLMHGDADRVIPLRHSRELFARAGEPKQIWVAEGARHAELFDAHPEEWAERVLDFLGSALAGRGGPR